MNEIDRWIYLDGPVPASVRPLLEALREEGAPRPQAEDKARVIADFFATFAARLGRMSEGGEEQARASTEAEEEVLREEAVEGDAPLDFEAWAALSMRLLGASEEEQSEALTLRRLTPEAWAALDEGYLRTLSEDLATGRMDRQALYAATCSEEMARRSAVAEGEEQESEGEEQESGREEEDAVPTPAMQRAPNKLRGTAEALDIPAAVREAMGQLPFKEAPEALAALKRATPKTLQGAARQSSVGGTLPLGSEAIQKAMAVMPFAGAAGGAGVVLFPSLTVAQYVALRAELVLRPDQAGEVLRRYGVASEGARRALDAHWYEQLAQKAELRAEYEAVVGSFARSVRGW